MIEKCRHPLDKQILVVIDANAGCETTRVKCRACNQFITKPKTDC